MVRVEGRHEKKEEWNVRIVVPSFLRLHWLQVVQNRFPLKFLCPVNIKCVNTEVRYALVPLLDTESFDEQTVCLL